MGTIRNGANGGFKGKAGSIIGSSWKGIHYIKGLYKKRSKPATEEQLMQQAKFGLVTKFLFPIKALIRIGYGQKRANTHTAMNMAVKDNIVQAVVGNYPDYALDYGRVKLSAGGLFTAGDEAMALDGRTLSISWNPLKNPVSGEDDDGVYTVVYHPGSGQFTTANVLPIRSEGSVEINLPVNWAGGAAHVWLFYGERKLKELSDTVYVGEVTIA
ncbi:DUF6266 family protein [Olivibacter sitiensis]|uniref:DUF6266 family protein n=1 Tax=Olivibacter sitiensis TaxID=376470 RepID=UPI0006882906|nr:DUF6266 family protein [Olivibacter sitiensis]